MGCASSAQPMVTTAGNEMIKAATHLASDGSKKTEDVVQGERDIMEKTLESAGECIETAVQHVKQEIKVALHDKMDTMDNAKNSLLSRLHLGTEFVSAKDTLNIENQVENNDIYGKTLETEMETEMETERETENKIDIKDETRIVKYNIITNQGPLEHTGGGDNMSASSIEIAQAFANVELKTEFAGSELKNFTKDLITEKQHLHNYTEKDTDMSCTITKSKVINTNDMQEKTD